MGEIKGIGDPIFGVIQDITQQAGEVEPLRQGQCPSCRKIVREEEEG